MAEDIGWCADRFSVVLRMQSADDVARTLDEAIELFQELRRGYQARLSFGDAERDELLRALASARLGVEIYTVGDARAVFIGAITALQRLVVHYAVPPGRGLESDRFADCIDHMRLGQNICRNTVILADLEARSARRRRGSFVRRAAS